MIFVTLGTQKQSFARLLNYLEEMELNEEIVVQNGNTSFESSKMKLLGFVSYQEMEDWICKADLVISHGGGGSIFMALRNQKKVICVPRLAQYQEHINNHQIEMIDALVQKGYLRKANNKEELKLAILHSGQFKLKPYVPDLNRFMTTMKLKIDELLQLED